MIFVAAAVLCIPALVALALIQPDEIDYTRARNAGTGKAGARSWTHPRSSKELQTRPLHGSACAVSACRCVDATAYRRKPGQDASERELHLDVGPAHRASGRRRHSGAVGRLSPENRGRKPLLLIGFAVEPLRAALLAFTSSYPFLIVAQLFSGVTSAIIGVLTVLVITDLTTGTGRYNLAQGVVGAMTGIAASLSTLATGYSFQNIGNTGGFLAITADAGAATGLIAMFVSETKPSDYLD
jgi:hypothetical protein